MKYCRTIFIEFHTLNLVEHFNFETGEFIQTLTYQKDHDYITLSIKYQDGSSREIAIPRERVISLSVVYV